MIHCIRLYHTPLTMFNVDRLLPVPTPRQFRVTVFKNDNCRENRPAKKARLSAEQNEWDTTETIYRQFSTLDPNNEPQGTETKDPDTPVDVTYWPAFQELIDACKCSRKIPGCPCAHNVVQRYSATCPICLQQLSFSPVPENPHACVGVTTFTCGHMTGRRCARDYLLAMTDDDHDDLECLMCREDIEPWLVSPFSRMKYFKPKECSHRHLWEDEWNHCETCAVINTIDSYFHKWLAYGDPKTADIQTYLATFTALKVTLNTGVARDPIYLRFRVRNHSAVFEETPYYHEPFVTGTVMPDERMRTLVFFHLQEALIDFIGKSWAEVSVSWGIKLEATRNMEWINLMSGGAEDADDWRDDGIID